MAYILRFQLFCGIRCPNNAEPSLAAPQPSPKVQRFVEDASLALASLRGEVERLKESYYRRPEAAMMSSRDVDSNRTATPVSLGEVGG